VDTFNPYKVLFGFDLARDGSVGTADLPSLWNQKIREGMWLHWDGNNNSVTERNKSAAIGAGCSEASLDLAAMKRVEDWIWTLPAPQFHRDRIHPQRAAAGAAVYARECASCHQPGGRQTGQVVSLAEIGTDPERMESFSSALAERMNTLGTGRPWKFTHFRKTGGYAAMPLDGVWLRAPYLHNGSVPALRDLLETPERRPAVFFRGYDVYDYDNVGFVSNGPEAEQNGFRFDTSLKGNSRMGHLYGTSLPPKDKESLIEYLKTL
jgi:mono/diheme cytochrome c family protein